MPHPDFLLPLLTPRQFHEWFAYDQSDTFGEVRQDLRQAVLLRWLRNYVSPSSEPAYSLPQPIWPYVEDVLDSVDQEESLAYFREYKARKKAKAAHGQAN